MTAPDLDRVWRQDRTRVLATLIRLLGDFDLAEEALHEAFLAAHQSWPRDGVPGNPFGWLVSTGRFRIIDQLRRHRRMQPAWDLPEIEAPEPEPAEAWGDDRLRLILTCCHPDLPPEAQVALTLRTICGLTTEEIARAFLLRTPALAQRIVRAKARIREAGLRQDIPAPDALGPRLQAALHVVYLVFNEGYLSYSHADPLRPDLSAEAIRLGRLLVELLPDGETLGLLGLMLCHEARRKARLVAGELVALEAQDRSLWDAALIAEGQACIARAFALRQIGPFALQGAIAAVHAAAPKAELTDWPEIAGLYGVLLRLQPSPIVALNRAIAVSMVQGPEAGLALISPLLTPGALADYGLAHAAEAEMLRRLDRPAEAAQAYRRALRLCRQEAERPPLRRRLAEMEAAQGRNRPSTA